MQHGTNKKLNFVLIYAAKYGWSNILKCLIEDGIDVNAQDGTPLVEAAQAGHYDMVKILIEHGGDKNLMGSLYVVERSGHYDVVKFLLEHGAHKKSADALVIAGKASREKIVSYLTELGFDMNQLYLTEIYLAVSKGRYNIVKILIEHGAYWGCGGNI